MDVSQNPYPVKPTGFLIGALLACGLYGAHTSQIYVYFSTFSSDSWRTKLLVLWVYTLSSLQIIIIAASAWKYYVWGVSNPNIWGEFWWPLSVQDGLIPLMAFTAQLFFGYRAWRLNGRRRWMAVIFSVLPVFTMMFGIGLAVTARIWSDDPWVSAYDFGQRQIGVPSQAVAIAWMGLSAFTDGTLTAALVYRFMKARRTSVFDSTQSMAARLIALTLETVLLTHLVGGVMCIIFLASPPAHRTDQDIFWVLLEIVTELYALSILFTINARAKFRRAFGPQSEATEPPIPLSDKILPADQSAIDMQVEGYQGSSPFGVAPYKVGLHHASATDSSTKDSSMVETPNEIPLPVLYVNEGSSGGTASLGSGNSSAESARPVWSAPKQ